MSCTITSKTFGITPSGEEVSEYTLSNGAGILMRAINYGCTITSLKVPDRDGVTGDIVLGYDTLDGYLACTESVGCVVGRYANRIAFGKFDLEGKTYQLNCNLPPHHLHGGPTGWSRKVWKADQIISEHEASILFTLLSPDGDEGYPGNVWAKVRYTLGSDNTLSFTYRATTDRKTVINLTQHTYFNLNGGKTNILDHQLNIPSKSILEVDKEMIPTGRKIAVEQTPFNFNSSKSIGRDIHDSNEQLVFGHGYDHCWVLEADDQEMHHAARLFDPLSGRKMDVWTTEPGMQVYTANFLKGSMPGKNGIDLVPRLGICLETQHFPDAPNHPDFPSTILSPDNEYFSKTVLKFFV
jgi:aldose 1-epimerase